MSDELNGLDDKINVRGFFERVLKEQEKLDEERTKRIEEKFAELDKALKLQAREYERRLEALNGEYKRDQSRQAHYVSLDKWESTNEAEKTAREAALLRVNEKFDTGIKHVNDQLSEYIKRYELERREIDLRLAAQAGAAEEAKRAAEDQGRKSDNLSKEQARKQSRNLGFASLALGIFVFAANFLPDLLK